MLKDTIPRAFGRLIFGIVGGARSRRFIDEGNSHMANGEWQAAAGSYKASLEQDKMQPAIWVQLGHACKESGEKAKAREAYETAAQLEPENAETYLHLGHLLKNMGQERDAALVFAQCLKADPSMHDAYDQLMHLGWSRSEIIAAAPALQSPHSLDKEESGGEAYPTGQVYEAVRQMVTSGRQMRRTLTKGH